MNSSLFEILIGSGFFEKILPNEIKTVLRMTRQVQIKTKKKSVFVLSIIFSLFMI
mgnify:CR=1 FL=1